jgi:ribonuclease BN (tRNA processing enzyme)
LAFRFDTDAGSVSFSGDTARSDNVARLAAATDVLVHEVIDVDYYVRNGSSPEKVERMVQTHTSPHDVGRVATDAGAGEPANPAEVLSSDSWSAWSRSSP